MEICFKYMNQVQHPIYLMQKLKELDITKSDILHYIIVYQIDRNMPWDCKVRRIVIQ